MIPPEADHTLSIADRLRANFYPRIDPELRPPRTELARRMLLAQLGLLALWAVGLTVLSGRNGQLSVGWDVAAIVGLALLSGFCLWRLQYGAVSLVGYLISAGLLAIFTVAAFGSPDFLLLLGAGFLLPILVSGALVGARAPYLFAILAIAANTGAVLTHPEQFETALSRFIYLSVHAVVSLVAAAIADSLVAQVQRMMHSMHSQAEQMGKLALTDPLTSLPNRRQLFEQLEQEFARAQRYRRPFCLLYIDMDGFKSINDQFGHLFGDEILRGSARSMRAVLRATDLLARIGGDEFAVLLPETNLEGATSVASKLRKALVAYGSQLSPSMPRLTLSVGVGQIRPDDEAIEDILARADKAQYLAKTSGKALTRTQDDLGQAEAAAQP